MMRLFLLVSALPLFASEDVNEIVKRFIAADSKNWELAHQYTYIEQTDYFNVDKNGPKKGHSETHEMMFVEGEIYKKLVARNESPLDAKEQAKVDKLLRLTAEERRKQRSSGLFHRTVSVGSYEDLLTLFDSRLEGEDQIRGYKVWVIASTPKADHVPANTHEKEVLSFQRKYWINQGDDHLLKLVYTVVGPHATLMPDSSITWDFDKINEDAWLAISGVIDGRLQFAKFIKPAVRTEYKNSKFQKFDVQSTITIGPVK